MPREGNQEALHCLSLMRHSLMSWCMWEGWHEEWDLWNNILPEGCSGPMEMDWEGTVLR